MTVDADPSLRNAVRCKGPNPNITLPTWPGNYQPVISLKIVGDTREVACPFKVPGVREGEWDCLAFPNQIAEIVLRTTNAV